MTRRSEPRPNCTYCRGVGIISVSKDPDEIADCVCTDPVDEPAVEAAVMFAEDALGTSLMPWQREVLGRWVTETPPVSAAPREGASDV